MSYYIYVGGFDRRKRIDVLLSAFYGAVSEGLKSELYLIGEYKDIGLDIRDGVRVLGYVSDIELNEYYRNAVALIYPSEFEGFGLPPLGAMSLGCPVITTRGTSIPEVCGDAVIYFDDLKQTLLDLERDEVKREQMKLDGLERAKLFSWKATAKKYIDTLYGDKS